MQIPKQLRHASPFLLSLMGGILMGLTPAPVNAWPLAWIALVPLWFFVLSSSQMRQSMAYGLIWGIGYHGLALSWITGIHPMDWMGVPWLASLGIALFCWLVITLWGAFLVSLWATGLTLFRTHPYFKRKTSTLNSLTNILMGTALWCVLEGIWSLTPLWWSSVSYTQSPYNLIILHLGQLSGPLTVTAAIVAINGLLTQGIIGYRFHHSSRRQSPTLSTPNPNWIHCIYLAIILFISLHLIGFFLYSRPLIQPPDTALKVGIIQGNIPNRIKLYPEGWVRAIEGYTEGYKRLASMGVEAVLTPETALPFIWDEQLRAQSSFYAEILNQGVLTWVGAFGQEGERFTNSLFTVTGQGETVSRYDKVKLVPLGEYIPFKSVLGQFINRLSPLDAELLPGQPNQIFKTPFGQAIVGICYESAFPNHFRRQAARGGQFILTASNNAHYSSTMPAQHHAQDLMRAIETDRWAIRATNTGYSGIVDPHGRTQWISGINTYEIHADTIYRRQTQTLYVRWGNWFTPLLVGLTGLLFFFSRNLWQK